MKKGTTKALHESGTFSREDLIKAVPPLQNSAEISGELSIFLDPHRNC
jgi:hypothetical protein